MPLVEDGTLPGPRRFDMGNSGQDQVNPRSASRSKRHLSLSPSFHILHLKPALSYAYSTSRQRPGVRKLGRSTCWNQTMVAYVKPGLCNLECSGKNDRSTSLGPIRSLWTLLPCSRKPTCFRHKSIRGGQVTCSRRRHPGNPPRIQSILACRIRSSGL